VTLQREDKTIMISELNTESGTIDEVTRFLGNAIRVLISANFVLKNIN
jgi:hypothetical protein